jgi:hypothetical protein
MLIKMELFLLKSDQGYFKCTNPDQLKLVGIDKASVFPSHKHETLVSAFNCADGQGYTNIRIAKLTMQETDFYLTK